MDGKDNVPSEELIAFKELKKKYLNEESSDEEEEPKIVIDEEQNIEKEDLNSQ